MHCTQKVSKKGIPPKLASHQQQTIVNCTELCSKIREVWRKVRRQLERGASHSAGNLSLSSSAIKIDMQPANILAIYKPPENHLPQRSCKISFAVCTKEVLTCECCSQCLRVSCFEWDRAGMLRMSRCPFLTNLSAGLSLACKPASVQAIAGQESSQIDKK